MIIKRPVAGLLVDEVNTLPRLVIPHPVSLAVVRKVIFSARKGRQRDIRQYSDGRSCKSGRWNYCVRKHALSIEGATRYVVLLSVVNGVSQSLRKSLRPNHPLHTPGQGIVAAVKKIAGAEDAISLVDSGQRH